jgi:hypothetical protein
MIHIISQPEKRLRRTTTYNSDGDVYPLKLLQSITGANSRYSLATDSLCNCNGPKPGQNKS